MERVVLNALAKYLRLCRLTSETLAKVAAFAAVTPCASAVAPCHCGSPRVSFAGSRIRISTYHYGVGRGCGVGRGRGVTLGVAVGDGVRVGEVVGAGDGVAVGVGVGVGVGPAAQKISIEASGVMPSTS